LHHAGEIAVQLGQCRIAAGIGNGQVEIQIAGNEVVGLGILALFAA
jgi:hypothetical protein